MQTSLLVHHGIGSVDDGERSGDGGNGRDDGGEGGDVHDDGGEGGDGSDDGGGRDDGDADAFDGGDRGRGYPTTG